MSIEMVNEEGIRIPFPPQPEAKPDKKQSRVARESPPDKPLDGPTTKVEVQRALAVTYNLIHRIIHDPERYTLSDFAEEADGVMELLQQHAHLRIIMRIIAPLAAIGAVIEKAEGTIERFRARRAQLKVTHQKVAEQKNVSPNAPVEVQSNVVPSSVIANGAGKDLTADVVLGRPKTR